MEQTPSSPGHSPELPSVTPPSRQEMGDGFSSPEVITGGAVERQEQRSAAPSAVSPPVSAVQGIVSAAPPADDTKVTLAPTSSLPTVAGDDDLIEKEWVDKAKKVIAETKDDPYRREQEVTRLQIDYLAKRYGRQLGPPQ